MNPDTYLNPSELATYARSRAGLYSAAALHFNTVMDGHFVDTIRSPQFKLMLETIGDGEESEDLLTLGAVLMAVFIEKTRSEDRQQLADRLGAERTRLYRGLSAQYEPPPYEALWTAAKEETQLLGGLTDMYRAAGVALDAERPERADYLGVELDFMRVLAEQEAAAWESEHEEQAARLFEAQQQFFNEHLASWVPDYAAKVSGAAQSDFYRAQLRMLEGLMHIEQETFA
jgi:TorA maturation chaperone TorD